MSSAIIKYLNPNWKSANIHSSSVKPGLITNDQNIQICQCCYNTIPHEKIQINTHAKQLEFLGFGFPLWFTFLKYCTILILILIISYSIQSIYHGVNQNKVFCNQYYWGDKNTTYIHNSDITVTRNFLRSSYHHLNNQLPKIQTFNTSSTLPHVSSQSLSPNIQSSDIQSPEISSSIHKNKHSIKCTSIFILLSRINHKVTNFQQLIRITTFIMILITLAFMRDNLYKTEQYYDQRRCSISDYSIIISNIPKIQRIQQKLTNFFKNQYDQSLNIQQIILIPEYQQLSSIQHQRNQKIKHLQKHYKKSLQHQQNNKDPYPQSKQLQQISQQINLLDIQQKQQIQIFKKQMLNDKLTCQRAIIVFNTESQKEKVLDQFDQINNKDNILIKYFGYTGELIKMDQAPQPRQIIWENINYPNQNRLLRICIGWGLSLLFIIFITIIFYLILKYKTHLAQQQQYIKHVSLIVYSAILLVILFNKFIMGTVLHYFTDLQMHATADRYQFSFAFKYALGMFFTTALMTLFVQAFTYNNFYTHPYGVIQQQSIMFFMNSLLVPLIWLINPFQIIKIIKRYLNYGKNYYTQKQANYLMEDFKYDIGKRYAEILQSMWFTFLYASLIPMGAFLSLIGVGLYYWVDKYNLLRRSSVHENISGKLSLISMKLLDAVLILLPLGQIIFDRFLRQQTSLISLICLIIGIIYLLLPINQILDCINEQKFHLQSKQYQDVKHTFKQQYYDLHPIYKKTHTQYNKESRLKYKNQIVKNIAKPMFSFIEGWVVKGKSEKKGTK